MFKLSSNRPANVYVVAEDNDCGDASDTRESPELRRASESSTAAAESKHETNVNRRMPLIDSGSRISTYFEHPQPCSTSRDRTDTCDCLSEKSDKHATEFDGVNVCLSRWKQHETGLRIHRRNARKSFERESPQWCHVCVQSFWGWNIDKKAITRIGETLNVDS